MDKKTILTALKMCSESNAECHGAECPLFTEQECVKKLFAAAYEELTKKEEEQ